MLLGRADMYYQNGYELLAGKATIDLEKTRYVALSVLSEYKVRLSTRLKKFDVVKENDLVQSYLKSFRNVQGIENDIRSTKDENVLIRYILEMKKFIKWKY